MKAGNAYPFPRFPNISGKLVVNLIHFGRADSGAPFPSIGHPVSPEVGFQPDYALLFSGVLCPKKSMNAQHVVKNMRASICGSPMILLPKEMVSRPTILCCNFAAGAPVQQRTHLKCATAADHSRGTHMRRQSNLGRPSQRNCAGMSLGGTAIPASIAVPVRCFARITSWRGAREGQQPSKIFKRFATPATAERGIGNGRLPLFATVDRRFSGGHRAFR